MVGNSCVVERAEMLERRLTGAHTRYTFLVSPNLFGGL